MAETLSVTDMLPNKFEPKRDYRWVLAIEGIDSFLVTATKRPSITIGNSQIKFINSYRQISNGKGVFGGISVELHDPIAPSGAQQVMEWIRTHYESVSGRSGYIFLLTITANPDWNTFATPGLVVTPATLYSNCAL